MFALYPAAAAAAWAVVLDESIPYRSVFGPATALRALLHRNAWTASASGLCCGPLHASFNVRLDSPTQIGGAIAVLWTDTIHDACLQRTGCSTLAVPDACQTQYCLAQFQPWEQRILGRHIAGAFMSGAERSSWGDPAVESCPLCGQPDTKSHPILECPALSAARTRHWSILERVAREEPHWMHMAWVPIPEALPVFRLLCRRLSLPPLAQPLAESPTAWHMFTDGTALHGSCPQARLTAWAVTWCPCVHGPLDVQGWFRLSPSARVDSFRVLGQGVTPGYQSVPRAELAATIWAAKFASQHTPPHPDVDIFIHSDSKYACRVWEAIQRGSMTPGAVCENSDLVEQVFPLASRCRVFKVKAHVESPELDEMPLWEQWRCAGNATADAAAKAAMKGVPEVIRSQADSVAQATLNHTNLLLAFFRALVDVNVADAQLRKSAGSLLASQAEQEDHGDALARLLHNLRSWTVDTSPAERPSVPATVLENFPGGGTYAGSLVSWCRSVQWPTLPVPPQRDAAITFLELFVHYVWTFRRPPFLVPGTANYLHFNDEVAQLHHRTLWSLVADFFSSIRQLQKLVPWQLMPTGRTRNLLHLQPLGISRGLDGVQYRPTLPGGGDWVSLLRLVASEASALPLWSHCGD